MAASGMAMMLKSLGLDPDELKSNVESFMVHMKAQAEKINANQARIERGLDDIDNKLDELERMLSDLTPQTSTVHILENGEPSGNLITNEKFPQEMINDVFNTTQTIGGQNGGRERSNNEE